MLLEPQAGSEPPLILSFPAPNVPLSENQSRRMHWAARGRRLNPWKDAVGWAWLQVSRPDQKHWTGRPCHVLVDLPFSKGGRRDPHNYIGTNVKALIDALVVQGVWPDDTPEWVTVLEPKLVHPSDEARVLLYARGD